MRGGLAVDRGVEREDHLLHLPDRARARPARRWSGPPGRRRRAATACRRARDSGR